MDSLRKFEGYVLFTVNSDKENEIRDSECPAPT